MTEFLAEQATVGRHILAEGPVWDTATSEVIWVDVEAGSVFIGKINGALIEPTQQFDFDGRIGAAVPGDAGGILVAAHNRLVAINTDGQRTEGPVIVADGVASRSNDGACDPAGRFLIGTLALDDREGQESLFQWDLDGTLSVVDADLTLSNGLAWSPDGTLFYSTDTVPGIIWVRDYDPATGHFGDRRVHLQIDGLPDGICVDGRGHLWVAIWGAGEVRSFLPTGEPGDFVRVPAPHVSSVAFVGDGLDFLLITTASRDLGPEQLAEFPGAGCLFLADVGVSGIPTTPWASSALAGFQERLGA